MFASVSGSMMVKFDFDSSISPHTSSQVGSFLELFNLAMNGGMEFLELLL